jgi:hypothetical protein
MKKGIPPKKRTGSACGPRDRHRFHAVDDVHVISILNSPLIGGETYDEDGSLEATGEVLPGPGTMSVKCLDELHTAGREKIIAGGSVRSIRILLQENSVVFTLTRSNVWQIFYVILSLCEYHRQTRNQQKQTQPWKVR